MNSSTESNTPQDLHITLELVSEDVDELDVSVTNAIGRDVLTALRNDDYRVRLVDTQAKTRGGELLIEITKIVTQAAIDIRENWPLIERGLTDTASLVQIMSGVVPVLLYIQHAHQKHARRGSAPIKFIVEIDGKPVTVEADNLEQAADALKLVQEFRTNHPSTAAKVTPHSKVKVKGTVPGQRRRKKK
jgi:hypothetical protein